MTAPAFSFTPEVLTSIRYHAGRGRDAREIGRLLGCRSSTILKICKEHGIKVHLPERSTADVTRTAVQDGDRMVVRDIGLEKRADVALAREARVRGLSPGSLASKIVETVALDGLWRAVLDE